MASLLLYRNSGEVLRLAKAAKKEGRHIQEEDLSVEKNISFLVQDGRFVWIGPDKKIPKEFSQKKIKEYNLEKASVLPGFTECHTHLVFAGSRAEEFELRNKGMSYQEIANRGGGILSTMTATRKASETALLKSSQARADEFIRQGVTTLEIKTGYALNLKDELKVLSVIRKIKGVDVVSTFLGAHAKPPEFADYDSYLDFLAEKVLPVVAKKKLAERVDIFIEEGFFSRKGAEKYLRRAQALGFEIVIHADQLSLSGGSELATSLKALSADHVIKIDENQIQKLAKSEVTSVLLPAADLYMRCDYPPARKLIDAGARVALATDFNPGTSPTQDLSLVGLLARLEMKMTLPEVIGAYTIGSAFALKRQKEIGSIEIGKRAHFISLNEDWRKLFYSAGSTEIQKTYRSGQEVSI